MSLTVEITNAETFDRHLPAYHSFLKRISLDTKTNQVLPNMGMEPPGGLLYLIQPERDQYRRWTMGQGEIALLYDRLTGSIVGLSAVENSPLSDNISSGGNRCWLLKEYRTKNEVSNYLLASNFAWTQKQEKIGMMLTFNDYNKGIYDIIVARTEGRKVSIGKIWSNWWDDCVPIRQQILLHNVPQWAVIKPNADRSLIHDEINELIEIYGVEQ